MISTDFPARHCTREVMFTSRGVSQVYAITFFENISLKKSAMDALHRAARNISLEEYQLRRADNAILTSFQSVLDTSDRLRFSPSTDLPIGCASDWDIRTASKLKVYLDNVCMEMFVGEKKTLSKEASELIMKLSGLDITHSLKYHNISKATLDESLTQPICKSVYLMRKFPANEALIDSFISLLLNELGFYSDILYPIPQHILPLQYGGDVNSTAQADFNIIDMYGYSRMVVAKDQIVKNSVVDSFPQLLANAIAAVQMNLELATSKKRKWENLNEIHIAGAEMLGLRVNGTYFNFFQLNISHSILSAMKNKRIASEHTIIKGVGGGLDFMDPTERVVIITILDA